MQLNIVSGQPVKPKDCLPSKSVDILHIKKVDKTKVWQKGISSKKNQATNDSKCDTID